MSGPKGVLAKAALNELPNTPGEVITFVREWRPVGDGTPINLQHIDFEPN
jgi:hypothetical protein